MLSCVDMAMRFNLVLLSNTDGLARDVTWSAVGSVPVSGYL